MKKHHKLLLTLAVSCLALLGAASLSSAQSNASSDCYGDAMRNISPEARDSIRKAHEALTPVFVQYRAKQAELSAKIYSGADDKTIQDLAKAIEGLHSQLLEGRIGLQKQMAKAGVPMRGFHKGMMGDPMDCPGMGGYGGHMGGHGGHMGGHGGHMGGMMNSDRPDAPGTGGDAKAPPAKGQK